MEMSSVRDEIMDAQNSNRRKAGIVSDILNNIENLYRTGSCGVQRGSQTGSKKRLFRIKGVCERSAAECGKRTGYIGLLRKPVKQIN